MWYNDQVEDWAYRYEISAPTYKQAVLEATNKGLRLREWNWKPDDRVGIRDKRAL